MDNDLRTGMTLKSQRALNEQYSLQDAGSIYSNSPEQWHPAFLEAEDRCVVVIVSLQYVNWESTRI